jgi:hypothetical protein
MPVTARTPAWTRPSGHLHSFLITLSPRARLLQLPFLYRKAQHTQRRVNMHIQIVNFNLAGITEKEYEDICSQVAGAFAMVPGLLSKVWLADPKANTFGGVYTWRDEQALRDYEATELFQKVVQNPHFANITIREFGVLEEPTRVTNGFPLATAA